MKPALSIPWRTCDNCQWSEHHEPTPAAPHLGIAPEAGYFTCRFDGLVKQLDDELGDEMPCWMPKLDEETQRMIDQEEEKVCALLKA